MKKKFLLKIKVIFSFNGNPILTESEDYMFTNTEKENFLWKNEIYSLNIKNIKNLIPKISVIIQPDINLYRQQILQWTDVIQMLREF